MKIIKESKEKEIYKNVPVPPAQGNIEWKKQHEQDRAEFLKRYPTLRMDFKIDDSNVSYSRLAACFERSKNYLANTCSFSWVVKHYEEIIDGKYDDYPKIAKNNNERSVAPLSAVVQAINAKADRERYYSLLREKAQARADKFIAKANGNARFKEITAERSKMEIALAKAEVFEPKQLPALEEQKTALLVERSKILQGLGITEAELSPQFTCRKCSDTGFLKSGAACNCYKQKEN